MNHSLYIASKYLFSFKNKNIINIISVISLIGVLFGTMAMIIVLSVFNGFDEIIQNLYNKVDSDFKIELRDGGMFELDDQIYDKINQIQGITAVTEVLESKLLAQYLNHQLVVNAKGVGYDFINVSNLEENILLGTYFSEKQNFVIIGNGIFHKLSLKLLDFEDPLKLSFFDEKKDDRHFYNSIKTEYFYVSGVFSTQVEFDDTYIVLSIHDLRKFLDLPNKSSAIEIKIDKSFHASNIQEQLKIALGDLFIIKNKLEQRPFVYKMVRTEKLAVYIIFSFILIISMLSLIANLIVLLMEKQNDIFVLYSLGYSKQHIKMIFLKIGVLITFLGSALGSLLGLLFCFIQDKFGLIKLGESTYFLDAYPVQVNLMDFLTIQCIVLFFGLITSYFVSKNDRFYNYC